MAEVVRVALTGVGNRPLPKNPDNSQWLGWVELMKRHPGFELVAAHDVDRSMGGRIAERGYLDSSRVYENFELMLTEVEADALLVCTPAEYHADAVRLAAQKGLHVMVEKPFVTDIGQGAELVAKLEDKGLVSLVVQNWRYKSAGLALKKAMESGMIGRVGHIFFRYVRNRENPNYPSYIFEEDFPLLYAMGIHHFDLFRYLLGQEIAVVGGSGFKPPWSMYKSVTGHNLTMYSDQGVYITYSGSISSQNRGLPQESLIIEGENGTLVNDSDWLEPPVWFYPKDGGERVNLTSDVEDGSTPGQYDFSDQYILDSFYRSVAQGEPSICSARDALASVAVIEAARRACETGERVKPEF